jgi:hypothetical protein
MFSSISSERKHRKLLAGRFKKLRQNNRIAEKW